MALHLLKLIWNRKRANFLIVTEILLSFLVLAAVTTVAVHYWRNYQAPLGFSYERIWDVVVRVPRGIDSHAGRRARAPRAHGSRLVEAVRQMPEVESVSHIADADVPQLAVEQRHHSCPTAAAWTSTATAAATSSPRRCRSRWSTAAGSRARTPGQNWEAVVINAAMARDVFGTEQAAGKTMPRDERTAATAGDGPPPRRSASSA